jgi:cellulose synthase/poly-beta-1,6-N-acetylglucosamine synthase-like glycosyltransferase
MKLSAEQTEQIEISVVVPVFNEEGNLPILIPKLIKVLNGLRMPYEVIFVDDGSSDGSRKVLNDMVTGWRQEREDPWLKRISSKIANSIRNRLSRETIKDIASTFRVFKRECFEDIPKFNGMHRFFPTLVKMEGYRVIEIPVSHHPRRFGRSKYNIRNRMWRSFIDLLAVRWMKSRHITYDIEERT